MLSEELKKQIQTSYSTLLENKELKPRVGQRIMIADIARTLANIGANTDESESENPNIAIIEAGTGTGKTVAYCIPTIAIAKSLKKKVIISTATIALQEQIILKDLPELLNLTPLDFSFTLAKGRRRYVCLSLLNKFNGKSSSDSINQQSLNLPTIENTSSTATIHKVDYDLYKKFQQKLHNKQWNGERDDWKDEIDHQSWFAVTADHHQCSGRNCGEYDRCIFYKARERVFKADCVVANHDLVLSDLAMGGGIVLPAPEDTIYVFDEGHHLPDKAISHFSYSIQLYSTSTWLTQLSEQLQSLLKEQALPGNIKSHIKNLQPLTSEASDYMSTLVQMLEQNLEFEKTRDLDKHQGIYRFKNGLFPTEFHPPIESLKIIFKKILNHFDMINDFCQQVLDETRVEISMDLAEYWVQQLLPALGRMQSSITLWRHYLSEPAKANEAPYARWIYAYHNQEFQENKGNLGSKEKSDNEKSLNKNDLMLHSCPVLPSTELQSLLWDNCYAAVITSATLSSAGNFRLFQLNTGVDGYFNSIPSHFNYQEQVQFYVPPMTTDPTQGAAEHTDEVAQYLADNLDVNKGTLVLFSSKKQLQDVEYFLFRKDKSWQELILTQGKSNKQEIIRQHKKNIDKNKGSIIFGLASFSEGVDLPGKYCEHVVICKLPFSVPDNPVDETLSEWMREQGRNHFFEVSVPQTTIKLIQACGRLIRHESDSGQITLLDRRILTKRYGRDMLAALPPYAMKQ